MNYQHWMLWQVILWLPHSLCLRSVYCSILICAIIVLSPVFPVFVFTQKMIFLFYSVLFRQVSSGAPKTVPPGLPQTPQADEVLQILDKNIFTEVTQIHDNGHIKHIRSIHCVLILEPMFIFLDPTDF